MPVYKTTDDEKIAAEVPLDSRLAHLQNSNTHDFAKMLNAMLKQYGLRIRTKAYGRGGGQPTWVWIERLHEEEPAPMDLPQATNALLAADIAVNVADIAVNTLSVAEMAADALPVGELLSAIGSIFE